MGSLDFDAQGYEREPDQFDLLPPGTYKAVIEEAEIKETKNPNNDDRYLKLKIVIQDEAYKNRVVFDNLNIWNSNSEAVRIAKNALHDICAALNLPSVKEPEELKFKELAIKVGIQEGRGQYDDQNRVKKYLPASDAAGTARSGSSPSSKAKAPWDK